MANILTFRDKARKKLFKGASIIADAVTTTLGPKGRNVAIDRGYSFPVVVHDGVTVAREVNLKDKFENMGAALVKEAASKTNDQAGDGTTTATLLAYCMMRDGLKYLDSGSNPMIMKKGMDKAVKLIIEELKKIAKPVNGREEIEQIASVSAQDSEIGKIIADAIEQVGRDGVVSVEEGKGIGLELKHAEGMEFDKGYVSSYFVTDKAKMVAEIDHPYILITDQKISSVPDILPFLQAFAAGQNKDLVIIADMVEGEALATLILNTAKGNLRCVVVRAPEFGDKRIEFLEDIATMTGGKVVSIEAGGSVAKVNSIQDWCGKADKVWVSSDTCRIIGGSGELTKIQERVEMLRESVEQAETAYEKEHIRNRLAKLTGGVAVINVGATSEVELKDRKERVIDAVSATQSAIEEGVIAGGGVALLKLKPKVLGLWTTLKDDEANGCQVVFHALDQPTRKILENAGERADVVMEKIKENKNMNYGYDIIAEEYGDLVKKGIIDPVKVTRLAIQNAVSISSMILTTDCLITPEDIPQL